MWPVPPCVAPGFADLAIAKLTAAGTPDPGFGAGGLVTTHVPAGTSAEIRDLAVDAEGNVVAFGSARGGSSEQVVARYLPDGTLDSLFGGGDGIATASFASPATAEAGAIAADGGAGRGGDGGRRLRALAVRRRQGRAARSRPRPSSATGSRRRSSRSPERARAPRATT